MKIKTKVCALTLALALGSGLLAGCGGSGDSGGGSTPVVPPTPEVTYKVNVPNNPAVSFTGLREDGLYKKGENVSFTVSLVDETKVFKEVGYDTTKLGEAAGSYSFAMPEKNVNLYVRLENQVTYELQHSGSVTVGGDPVAFVLMGSDGDPYTGEWTLEAAVEGIVSINNHDVTGAAAGTVELIAYIDEVEVDRESITVEKTGLFTLREAIDDAWANTPDFNDNSKETKTTKKYQVQAMVMTMGDPYKDKVEMILDDGTALIDYTIKSSDPITKFSVGDVIQIEEPLQNYKGLIEMYSSKVDYVTVLEDVTIEPTPYTVINDAEEYKAIMDAKMLNDGEHQITPLGIQAYGIEKENRYQIVGSVATDVTYKIATSKTAKSIGLEWNLNTVYGFTGYLINHYAENYSHFMVTEQRRSPAESVVIDQEGPIQLVKNEEVQLTYTTTPAGTGYEVEWSVEPEDIVEVDENGLVKALAAGEATVKVTVDGHEDTVAVKVSDELIPATSAEFSETEAEVHLGSTLDLNELLAVSPEKVTDIPAWSVEEGKEGVLSVANGVVTPSEVGEATVTVKFNESVSASILVKVLAEHGKSIDDPLSAKEAYDIGKKLAGESGKSVYTEDEYYVAGVYVADAVPNDEGKVQADNAIDGLLGLYWTPVSETAAPSFEKGAVITVLGQICNYSNGFKIQFASKASVVKADNTVPQFIEVEGPTSLTVGDNAQLVATVYPASLNAAVTFESSNEEVATVSESGLVEGVSTGNCVITASYDLLSTDFNLSVVGASTKTLVVDSLIGLNGVDKDGNDVTISSSTADATQVPTLKLNDLLTLSVNPDGNNGKIYGSGTQWRLYQKNSPAIALSIAEGYELIQVVVTYSATNGGILSFGGNNYESGAAITVSGSSATFGVANTGTAENGQVRITGITVIYCAK
jgi:hypothetical protein